MLIEHEKYLVHTLKISKSPSSDSVVDLLVEIQSNSLPFKLSASLSIRISILFFQSLLSIDFHEFSYS